MKRYQKFLVYWVSNSLILFLASLVLPNSVTIASNIFATYQAVVFAGFVWSAVLWYIEPVTKDLEIPMKDTKSMMLVFFLANFATVWFIVRFSFITGIGMSSFLIVLLVAAAGYFVQYAAWQYLDKKK